MQKRFLIANVYLFIALLLISCGGGSTVTSVSLTADPAQVDVRGRSNITARSEASVTDNTLGERVTFSIRHNETGSELDIISDRLDALGEAKALYRAGGRQGVDIVEASFSSGARATVTISVGQAVVIGNLRLEVFSDTGIGTHTGWRIRAIVTDTAGFPAPNQTVVFNTNNGLFFSADGTALNTASVTVTTDNAGFAHARLGFANAGETATVFATVGGLSASVNVGSRSSSVPETQAQTSP